MAVEKGQKYKGNKTGKVYEILSDVFQMDDVDYVVWREPSQFEGKPVVDAVQNFCYPDLYTLIREPKFKVGDRVVLYGETYEIVGVSSEGDYEGDFSYIIKDENKEHDHTYESRLKAAE
jgi:hypothetical protein